MPGILIRDLNPSSHDLLERWAEASGRSLQGDRETCLPARGLIPDFLVRRTHPVSAKFACEVRDR